MFALYRIHQQLHTWSRLLLAAWVLAFALVAPAGPGIRILLPQAIRSPPRPLRLQFSRFNN